MPEAIRTISTGLKVNKFGVALDEAAVLFASLPHRQALKLVAIHVHIGSQMTSLEPIQRAAALVAQTAATLEGQGHKLEYLDLGGGLGISYDGLAIPSVAGYAASILDRIRPTALPIVLEPGRANRRRGRSAGREGDRSEGPG